MTEATHMERVAELARTTAPAARPEPAQIYRSKQDDVTSWRTDIDEVVTDIWDSRDLLHQLTLRDIRIRYKQAVMGFGWAIFMPMLVVMAGLLIRFSMATVSGTSLQDHALAGMAVKALAWAFFVGAIGFATPSLIGSQGLVSKVYFPREIIPISTIIAQLFDSAIGAAVLVLLLPFLGAVLTPQLLWVPLLVLLLVAFTTAAGLVLSCGNLFFRDVKYIVQVLLTFGIFLTPVFTEPEMFGATGARILMLNPIAPLLEGLRLAVAEGHNLLEPLTVLSKAGVPILAWTPLDLLYSAVWAFAGLFFSMLIFRRAAVAFAEYV